MVDNSNNIISQEKQKDQQIQIKFDREDKQIQTDAKLSSYSPRKQALRNKIRILQRQLRNTKQQVEQRQQQLKRQKNNISKLSLEEYCNITDQLVPSPIADFIKFQIHCYHKTSKGRRYSIEFKTFCLDLYFSGSKTYKLLCKQFALPNPRTLQRMIQNVNISPGLHDFIFEILKIKLNNSNSPLDKYCTLCMDEAALKANLYYNINLDEVIGFEDYGKGKSKLPTCNVAVLMLRGICNNWKQLLAYFFLNSTFSADELKNIIIQTIHKLQEIGYKVTAFVTDMGGNFMQAAKLLKVTKDSPFFIVNEQQIAYFIDPPHAIKAIRNNFYKNNIFYHGKLITWKFIEILYEIDQKNEMRLAPKLTDFHITPTNFGKMKKKLYFEFKLYFVFFFQICIFIN